MNWFTATDNKFFFLLKHALLIILCDIRIPLNIRAKQILLAFDNYSTL